MNRPYRASQQIRSPLARRGGARAAGIAMAALVGVLAIGLVVVLRSHLGSTSPAQAGSGGGSPAAGQLKGPRAGGATVARGQFLPHESPTFEAAREAAVAGEWTKAETLLNRLAEEHDDAVMDPTVNLALAEALLGKEDFAGAYKQYEKVIALEGKVVPAALHFQAGTVAAKAGMLGRAEEHYSMAQTADPRRAEYPLYLAMVQLRQGQTDPGLASLLRALKLNPELAEAWGTIAEVYFRDNKLILAKQNIEKARELQPRFPRWRIVEARILKREGKPRESLELLAAMDEGDRFAPEVVQLMAESYGMLGMAAEAAELYVKAAGRDRTNAEYHYQAALWLQRAERPAEALASARTAAMLGHEPAKELAGVLATAADPR